MYLLDTNICIALIQGHPNAYHHFRLKAQHSYTSSLVVAELYKGVFYSARQQENLQDLNHFLELLPQLNFGDRKVRAAAKYRCGYCLSPQSLVMARLEIEHIIPLSKGGSNTEENLWLACPLCNSHKASKVEALDPQTQNIVPLFNPRQQNWSDHFEVVRRWSKNSSLRLS